MKGKYRSGDTDNRDLSGYERNIIRPDTVHLLGLLNVDQRELAEAKEMYQRELQGCEKASSLNCRRYQRLVQ